MKKIYKFLLLTLMVLPINLLSQTIDYPRYEIDSLGQQVVVMTVKQAQNLDNMTDLLILLEKLNDQSFSYDSVCVKVINDMEKVIAFQKLEIAKLKEFSNNKDEQIKALLRQVDSYEKKVGILEAEVNNRQLVIDQKDKQIRGLKTKMIIGGIGGGAAIIGLVLIIIGIN